MVDSSFGWLILAVHLFFGLIRRNRSVPQLPSCVTIAWGREKESGALNLYQNPCPFYLNQVFSYAQLMLGGLQETD